MSAPVRFTAKALVLLALFPGLSDAAVQLRTRVISAATADHAPVPPGMGTLIVVADGKVTAAWKKSVQDAGAHIVTYLPDDAFLVRIDSSKLPSLQTVAGIAFVTPLVTADKIALELQPALDARSGRLPIHILVAPDVQAASISTYLRSLGLDVTGFRDGGLFNDVGAFLPADRADLALTIAQHPDVIWIEPRARRVLLNDTSIWVGQSGLSNGMTTPMFDAGIYGVGQTVAVLDTGVDYDMCYFRDPTGTPPVNRPGELAFDPSQRKVVAYNMLWAQDDPADPADYDNQGHGTHVAGTVLGDADQNLLLHDPADGMAPGAKLVVQDGGYASGDDCADLPGLGCPVVDLTPVFEQAYIQGARIHSNSWGDRENFVPQNTYTAACVDTDEFMYTHPDFLIVYAAGNGGPGPTTVGSPSTAKNTVSVGATNRGTGAEAIAGFSSRGNAADGRLRPTITSPGVGIISARTDFIIGNPNCATMSSSGTSMACPTTAGLAALIGEYYTAGFYPSGTRIATDGFTPSAALLKATLINSAQSMAGEPAIPSITQGWGRVTVAETLALPGGDVDLFVVDEPTGFPTGSTTPFVYNVDVRGSGRPLKATLTWTDPPSNPIAAINLINDLDLVVTGPSSQVYLGSVFANGVSTTGGAADRLNVEEQVLIPNPEPGVWQIRVAPFSVPIGPQPFALVVTGDLPTSLYMAFVSAAVVTDENGNGWPDPGERARIAITLQNRSDDLATPVRGRLMSRDTRVVILDDLANWPDVGPGVSSQSVSNHFEIELAPDWPCGAPIPLQLEVTAGARGFSMPFDLASGGLGTVVAERFDSTPVGQPPPNWIVGSNRPADGKAVADATIEPVATSPGPVSPPHALFIGAVATTPALTITRAIWPLDLSSYGGGPLMLSFRWWIHQAELGESLTAAVSDSGSTVFPWEILRTTAPFSSTSSGNQWGQTTVDLAALPGISIGANVHIRFEVRVDANETPGDAFYIDDLVVSAPTCEPVVGCSAVTATASMLPSAVCPGSQVVLDGSPSNTAGCTDVVFEWYDGATLIGTGVTLPIRPVVSTTYRLEVHCNNPLTCTSTDDLPVSVIPSTSSTVVPGSLRATRQGPQVELTWLGFGNEGFNVSSTAAKSAVPNLWTIAPINPTPFAMTTFTDTPAVIPVTHYGVFRTSSCDGASLP